MRLPISRPDLPRASSAMSGFFFCGMMLDPVEKPSSSATKPNSRVAQRMISSACRLTSTPIIAVTKANSATKSRDAVPSIELGVDPVKPRSRATASGSRPRLDPASAPAPYGESAATRASQSRSRATSRTSGQAWAIRWWLSSTGWACWRWVRPGMIAPRCCSAWSAIASTRSSTRPATTWAWSRRNTLNRVAIWSLRLRPARSLPPRSGPTRSTRAPSRAPWTSSSESWGSSSPASTRRSSSSMPASSSSSSASVSRPAACRARACAREPSRS